MKPPSDAYAVGGGTLRSRVIERTPFFHGWVELAAGLDRLASAWLRPFRADGRVA